MKAICLKASPELRRCLFLHAFFMMSKLLLNLPYPFKILETVYQSRRKDYVGYKAEMLPQSGIDTLSTPPVFVKTNDPRIASGISLINEFKVHHAMAGAPGIFHIRGFQSASGPDGAVDRVCAFTGLRLPLLPRTSNADYQLEHSLDDRFLTSWRPGKQHRRTWPSL